MHLVVKNGQHWHCERMTIYGSVIMTILPRAQGVKKWTFFYINGSTNLLVMPSQPNEIYRGQIVK